VPPIPQKYATSNQRWFPVHIATITTTMPQSHICIGNICRQSHHAAAADENKISQVVSRSAQLTTPNNDQPLDPLRFCAPYQCSKCKTGSTMVMKITVRCGKTVRLKFRRVVHVAAVVSTGDSRALTQAPLQSNSIQRTIQRLHGITSLNPSNIARQLLNRFAHFSAAARQASRLSTDSHKIGMQRGP